MGAEQKPGLWLCFQYPKLTAKATCRKIRAYLETDPFLRTHTYAAEARRESVPQLVQFVLDARERAKEIEKQQQNSKNGKNSQSTKD